MTKYIYKIKTNTKCFPDNVARS